MKKSSIFYFLLLLGLCISSCRNDNIKEEIIDNPVNPYITQETSVTGVVLDEAELPMEGVKVTINGTIAFTDSRGVFLIPKTEIETKGTAAVFEKSQYFANYRMLYLPNSKDKLFVQVNMTPKGNPVKFSSSDGGEISVPGGATITFDANSIIQEYNQAEYTGSVNAYVHWYNPTDVNLGLNSPASLIAEDAEGNEKGLYTYGMMAVELETEFGVSLNLKTGTSAELSFPIPSDLLSDAPDELPLWFVDEETGVWKEESSAQKVGNTYIGSVSHFSFWNCDVPFDLINIEGYLLAPDGTPFANYPVYVKREFIYGAYGFTNNVGYFSGKVPAEELLRLQISHCGVSLVDDEIGPFSADVDLGNFTVELTDFATTVSGTMTDCVGSPLSDAYGIVYSHKIITPALDGSFSTVVSGCGDVELQAQFFHGALLNQTDIISIDKDAATNNLGNIEICSQSQEYISFSIEGGAYRVILNPTIAIINNDKFILKGRTEGYEFSFNMSVPIITEGTTNPTKTEVYSKVDNNDPSGDNGGLLLCENETNNSGDVFLCDQFETVITNVDLVENIIEGTFSGILAYRGSDSIIVNPTDEAAIVGSFRSPITKTFNEASVSGKVWFDLNNNGTRDLDEEDNIINAGNFNLVRNDAALEFGNTYDFPVDSEYSFEGLEPGDYTINYYAYPYTATSFQQGDPEKDNDYILSNQNVLSTSFTLGDGEDKTNIDAGFAMPDEVFCNLNYYGCTPDITLQYSIGGGVPPYSITLSNGFSDVVTTTYNTIDIGTGGEYTYTVEDAIGNTCSSIVNVEEYNNSIYGYVWEDLPGENENYYDFGSDNKLTSVVISLYTENGSLVNAYSSDNTGYGFNYIPYGNYYIEVEVPAGLELLPVNTAFNANHINPTTMRSDIISITECSTNVRKNAGYKQN